MLLVSALRTPVAKRASMGGPVTIAVDSYGPVTDNAQSVYELSLIEAVPNVQAEVKKDFNMDVGTATTRVAGTSAFRMAFT